MIHCLAVAPEANGSLHQSGKELTCAYTVFSGLFKFLVRPSAIYMDKSVQMMVSPN